MSTAAITIALTKSAARSLVERAERQTGSRMAAYEVVAQTVGTSADWLRKFVKGSEAKEPRWSVGWSLIEHYQRLCERVEHEIETERLKITALKRDIDAVTAPVARMVGSAPGAEATGAAVEAAAPAARRGD